MPDRIANGGADFIDRLFGSLLDSKGMQGVLSLTRSFFGVGLAFFDQKEGRVFVDSEDDDFSERCRFYPLAEVLRLYRHWRIERADAVGFLVADANYRESSPLTHAVSHVINALLLCRSRDREKDSSRMSRVDEENLLRRLIEAEEEELEGLAGNVALPGLALGQGFFVAAVTVRLQDRRYRLSGNLFSSLCMRYRNVLQGSQPRAISASVEDCFAVAFFCDRQESAAFLLKNIETVTRHFASNLETAQELAIYVGIGNKGQNVGDFSRSWREATVAIRNTVLNAKDVRFGSWCEMGAERMLAVSSGIACGNERIFSALTELRLLQKTHTTPFFSTIVSLVRNHWNITATASGLSLHYNSMKYRYDKIGEILQLDMDDPGNRFELSMLVRSYLYEMPLEDFFEVVF